MSYIEHKSFLFISICFIGAFISCSKNEVFVQEEVKEYEITEPGILTDNVTLGRKLVNPYSVSVMKKACDALFPPTRGEAPASDSLIEPNYLYVRFLPEDSTDISVLTDSGLELYNYPLDYEILGDPEDYYDSSLPEGRITWQYTAVPIEDDIPDVEHQILDVCYIPNSSDSTYNPTMERIEDRAIVIADNGDCGSGGTSPPSSGGNTLNGRVRVKDTVFGYEGIKGIKVRARFFLKIRTDYTDEEGNYSICNDFRLQPRFELRFENKYGFKSGYGIGSLVLPSTMNMKYHKNIDIDKDSGHKWWVLATINNAGYDWFRYCELNNITKPAGDLRIWALTAFSGASTIMLHHGLFNHTVLGNIITFISWGLSLENPLAAAADLFLKNLVKWIGPDITVCDVESMQDSYQIYEYVCHELAHATHFQSVGSNDWDRCEWWIDVFDYELMHLSSPTYGEADSPLNGPCGVTEMWAYAMGYYMRNLKYFRNGNSYNGTIGLFWFKPEFLWDLLTDNVVSSTNASKCLKYNVLDIDSFIDELIKLYPDKKTEIEDAYNDENN